MKVKDLIELLSWYPGEAKVDISRLMVLSVENFALLKARHGGRTENGEYCPAPEGMKVLPTDLSLAGLAFDPKNKTLNLLTLASKELLEAVDLPDWSPSYLDDLEMRHDESKGTDPDTL